MTGPLANDPRRERRSGRVTVGVVLPALALIVTGVAVGLADSVPDPMASHWDLDGDPNDSVTKTTFYALFLGLVTVTGAAGFWVSRRRTETRGDLRAPVAVLAFLQWTFVGVTVAATVANHEVASWEEADQLPVPIALLIPGAAILVALLAGWLVRDVGEHPRTAASERSSVGRGPGERLAWLNHASARWPLVLGGVMVVLGTQVALLTNALTGAILVVAAALVLMFSTIQVTADRRGVIVRYGPLRWPRTRIGLDRIDQATAIDVVPLRHGGWGYRGSVRVFGRASVVIRAGEGLQLDLRDGKRFTVTVDDAATAAGTINDLLRA